MPVDLRAAKKELRDAVLTRRNQLSPAETERFSAAIARTVCQLPVFTAATTLAAYMTIGNEVRTEEIIRTALAAGKRVVLPRTILGERRLALHHITDLGHLVSGPYNIPEPAADAPEINPAEVDLFLVPGTVFDAAGNRLGYGAGLYDSLLVMSEGWRVALAYAGQLAPHVPMAEHDMPMDLLVTELGVIDCRQARNAADHLRRHNMIFYGYHGAFPQERGQGIRLAVDVDLRMDLQVPGLTDDLATTVNYPAIYRLIERIQSEREFALFEALVDHIAAAILWQFPAVSEVTVKARKFNPPVGGLMDAFEVEISRTRSAWMRPTGI